MAGRLQPITLLFKLLDTCNQCALAFRVAVENSADSAFCGFSGKLQPALGRFVFELQSEMRRSQDFEWGQPRSYVATAGTASFLRMEAERCLAEALAAYEDVMQGRLPAHARAMVGRQYRALREFHAGLKTERARMSA